MKQALREILAQWADLSCSPEALSDQTDLYEVGLSSLTAVQLLLAIETRFGIVIPDEMLTRSLFQSIDAMADHIALVQKRRSGT